MTKPTYFRNFPNNQYALRANKAGQSTFIDVKDYFSLALPRSDIFREETLYTIYTVQEGRRPDEVSYDVYGDEQYYWVVLQINEITDYYNQWPLAEVELQNFMIKKYGSVEATKDIHHYETVRTYDASEPKNLILPGGLVVPKNFIYYYPPTPGSTVRLSTTPVGVTNYQYERDLNDKKAQISILDRRYIFDYVREVKNFASDLSPRVSFRSLSEDTLAPYRSFFGTPDTY